MVSERERERERDQDLVVGSFKMASGELIIIINQLREGVLVNN